MPDDERQLLKNIESGDEQSAEVLLPIVYDQLRSLASRRLANDPAGHSLETTELVHEAYLRLLGGDQPWDGSRHFFAAAAEAMRRILVERARKKMRLKHGAEFKRIDLSDPPANGPTVDEVLTVHELLDKLAADHPVEAELVKLHYFAGLNLTEAGEILGVSSSTAHRYWKFARSWLRAAAK